MEVGRFGSRRAGGRQSVKYQDMRKKSEKQKARV